MSEQLDRAFDHAAIVGARIIVLEIKPGRWVVRLEDAVAGCPAGAGASPEIAAAALMRGIDAQLPEVRP